MEFYGISIMRKIIYILISIFFIISCKKEDDTINIPRENQRFVGQWHFIQNGCFCPDYDGIFDRGDHIWTFNEYVTQLEIKNNAEHVLNRYEDGVYNVVILNEDRMTITKPGGWSIPDSLIESLSFIYKFTDSTLTIRYPGVDGDHYTLVR